MRDFFDPNIFEIYHSLSWYFSRYNNLYISPLYFCEILYDLVQKKKKKKIVTSIQTFVPILKLKILNLLTGKKNLSC